MRPTQLLPTPEQNARERETWLAARRQELAQTWPGVPITCPAEDLADEAVFMDLLVGRRKPS